MIEAEVDLDHLFKMDDNVEDDVDIIGSINHKQEVYDEAFAYHRTLSRLREMQTKEYQELSLSATQKGAQEEKKEARATM